MASPIPVSARIHFDDIQKEFRLVASREDPKTGTTFSVNELVEVIDKFTTLVQLVAFLLDFMSAVAPTATLGPEAPVIGDWTELAIYAASRADGDFKPHGV